jgi:hypothetical protein
MGISKLYLNKEQTVRHLVNRTLTSFLKKGDVFVFTDNFSHRVYESYLSGLTDEELFNIFEKEIID